jgi:hypothetical protein
MWSNGAIGDVKKKSIIWLRKGTVNNASPMAPPLCSPAGCSGFTVFMTLTHSSYVAVGFVAVVQKRTPSLVSCLSFHNRKKIRCDRHGGYPFNPQEKKEQQFWGVLEREICLIWTICLSLCLPPHFPHFKFFFFPFSLRGSVVVKKIKQPTLSASH